MDDRRLLVVIAGHNGAGKTTIYRERLANLLSPLLADHINPDEVEQSITTDLGQHSHRKEDFEKLAADEATRRRRQYLDREVSFSFETVLSDPQQDKVRFMEDARRRGYLVVLMGVGLESIEKSKERVAIRHANGGHNIRPDKLESRYERVLLNFAHGAHAATMAIFFDNSEDRGDDGSDTYWDIAFFEDGGLTVEDHSPPPWWLQVKKTFYRLDGDRK